MDRLVYPSRIARILFILAIIGAASCKRQRPEPATNTTQSLKATTATTAVTADELAAFSPLPSSFKRREDEKIPGSVYQARINLGRTLYYDKRLSKNRDISCNTCHLLDKYGVDGKPVSPGDRGQLGARNSPTVYNAAGHATQFWDGRAADVEEQAKGPILNPVEMAMPNEAAVVAVLTAIPQYVKAFKAAFPSEKKPLTYDTMARAIGAFERGLVTPTRWDTFLKEKKKGILSAKELRGVKAFVATGCTVCHSGALIGGGAAFQKLGMVRPWPTQKDQGRYEITHQKEDRMKFKVPSLRNVARTGPYFHDGSISSLKRAVVLMAKHQLGRDIDDESAQSIVAFLEVLTGEIPTDYIAKPLLP